MRKKILVTLLAFSMIVTTVPAMAAGDDTVEIFDSTKVEQELEGDPSNEMQELEVQPTAGFEAQDETEDFQDDFEPVFQDSTGEVEFQSEEFEEQIFSDETTYMVQGGWTVTDLIGGNNGISHDQAANVWTVNDDAIISGGNDIAPSDRGTTWKEQLLLLKDRIIIAEDAVITLDNANVILPQSPTAPGLGAALTIKEGKNVTLKLKGANKICAGLDGQGILVEQDATLTIQEEEPGASLYVEAASEVASSSGGNLMSV